MAFLLLAGCARTQYVSDVASGLWHEARTDHFVVMTDAGERRARQLVDELETFRRFVIEEGGLDLTEDALPFHIIAVSGQSDLNALVGNQNVFGAFQQTYRGGLSVVNLNARAYDGTDDLNVTVTPLGRRFDVRENFRTVGMDGVLHEYVHHLLATDQNRRYPIWFHEGYAEYLSTLRKGPDGKVRVGAKLPHRLDELNQRGFRWIPLGALFNARRYETGHGEGSFYPQSWVLVHYMMAKPERRAKLYEFLDRLNEPVVDAQPIFEDVWGEDVETVAGRVRQYARSGKFRVQKHDVSIAPLPEPIVRIMPRSDVAEALAYATLRFRPDSLPEATRLVEEAAAIDPTNMRALTMRAAIALYQKDVETAMHWVEKAGPVAQTDAGLQTMLGHIATQRVEDHEDPNDETWRVYWEQARQAFETAIMLDPDAAEAHVALARLHLFNPVPAPDSAMESIRRTRALLPTNFEAELIRGHLHVGRGEWQDALDAYDHVIAWSRVPQTVTQAREMRDKLHAFLIEIAAEQAASQQGLDTLP